MKCFRFFGGRGLGLTEGLGVQSTLSVLSVASCT